MWHLVEVVLVLESMSEKGVELLVKGVGLYIYVSLVQLCVL